MTEPLPSTQGQEIKGFLIITAVLIPALSVALVGTYGFAIWIYQLLAGPPSAP